MDQNSTFIFSYILQNAALFCLCYTYTNGSGNTVSTWEKKCMGIYCYEHLWLECNENTWETEARRAAHYSWHALYEQTNETIRRTACYNNSNIQELDSLRQWHGCLLKIRSTCMTEISLLCHFSTLNCKSQCSQSCHQPFFNKLPERRGGILFPLFSEHCLLDFQGSL